MIYSEQEYQTTLKAAARFEQALAQFDSQPEPSDPLLREMVRASLETELEILRNQLDVYLREQAGAANASDRRDLSAVTNDSPELTTRDAATAAGAGPNPLFYQDLPDILDLRTVAKILNVGRAAVQIWAKQGRIPAVKVGKSYRVRLQDLRAWYNANAKV